MSVADQSEQTGRHNPYYPIADALRQDMIERSILPYVRAGFRRWSWFKSAALLVAQYWDDNARDELHYWVLFSELKTPDYEAAFEASESREPDRVNNPSQGQGRQPQQLDADAEMSQAISQWEENNQAIPAFACYCREGGDQCASARENYAPYALFRRDQPDSYEVVGEKLRPWLDGIAPAWHSGRRIQIGVEIWDGEAWRWLEQGPALCWEVLFAPGRALPEMLAEPDSMALDTQADVPDDISPAGWEWACRERAVVPDWRWLTLAQLLECPGWELPVETSVVLSHGEALYWLVSAEYAWGDYGDWLDRPDPEWPEVRERELKNAGPGESFRLPWQQLRFLDKKGLLRKDLRYWTRIFFTRTLSSGCPAFKEKILPRLQAQVKDPAHLRLIYGLGT